MTTRLLVNDTSSFRIRRSLMTSNGIGSDVDAIVKTHLDELNELLGKLIFRDAEMSAYSADTVDTDAAAGTGKSKGAARRAAVKKPAHGVNEELRNFFSLTLTPKHIPRVSDDANQWENGSLAAYLAKFGGEGSYTLSDHIDQTSELAQLKYAYLDAMQQSWTTVPFNSRVLLESYPNITDYLIAYAYHRLDIRDEDALKHVLISNRAGARVFADYAAVSAARWLIDQEQLRVHGYNDDAGQFTKKLLAAGIPLSSNSFDKAVRVAIREFMFDRDEEDVIRSARIFPSLPVDLLPQLIKYLQRSPLQVTEANVDVYLPGIVLQLMRLKTSSADIETDGSGLTDEDFHVQFQDDSNDRIEINTSAVMFAAQLYHSMVLGEELDVFGAVHYLVHRRMNTFGGMRIEDSKLREDLERYVFDNRYLNLGSKSGTSRTPVEKFRTRPAERQMFHRQVFDQGNAEMPEDMLMNGEFKRLWKVLMLESARYLDRAQASMNPDSYVSRQNVMQAVEDLQYNLSTYCTGMATAISPAADAELNFVLERVLKHKEILRQVVPEGGTWKRAMDKLNGERRKPTAPANTLYNKAMLGKGIIEMIANYTPADFEGNRVFSEFIGKVDAFITTQSILQRPKLDFTGAEEDHDTADNREPLPELTPPERHRSTANGAASASEWDF